MIKDFKDKTIIYMCSEAAKQRSSEAAKQRSGEAAKQ
jgi:hypothetical protein